MKKAGFWIFNVFWENEGGKETQRNPPAQENPEAEGKPEYRYSLTISLKLIKDHKFEDPGHETSLT